MIYDRISNSESTKAEVEEDLIEGEIRSECCLIAILVSRVFKISIPGGFVINPTWISRAGTCPSDW